MAKRFLTPISLYSSSSDPENGAEGQIYFNTSSDALKIYYNSSWMVIPSKEAVEVSDTPPSNPVTGTIWFESDTGDTFIYYDQTWVQINSSLSPDIDDLLPSQTGNSGKFLTTDGSTSSWESVNAFSTISVPNGGNLAADLSDDNLAITSDNGMVITGTSETDSIQFSTNATSLNTASTIISRDSSQSFDITAIDFDTSDTIANAEGRLHWEAEEGTLQLGMPDGVIQSIGMEFYMPPTKNDSGVEIPNGSFVMATGAQGDRITIAKAVTDGTTDPMFMIGVATETIAIGSENGLITTNGTVRDIDTSDWIVGTILYPDPANAGGLTSTQPSAPNIRTPIAIVLRQHAETGRIYVRMTNGSVLGGTDSNVSISSIANNHILSYNGTTGVWQNQGLAAAIQEVDGASSGIDSDLLDGQHGSYYLDWTNTTNKPDPTITLGGDLSGSVTLTDLASGTLTATVADDSHNHIISNIDGLQTALDAKASLSGDTFTGNVGIQGISNSLKVGDILGDNYTEIKHVNSDAYGFDFEHNNASVVLNLQGTINEVLLLGDVTNGNDYTLLGSGISPDGGTSWVKKFDLRGTGELYVGSTGTSRVWHEGNDGASSGLDSDLLDGQHGSYYLDWTNTTNKPDPTITLGGDASGSLTLTNLAGGTLTVTVADDSHNHIISNIDGLQTALDAKAPLASPTFTGTPSAPTATAGTSSTQIATTAFVQTAVSNLVDSAPTTLDTLNELAAALGDDPNFATTMTTALGNKQPLDADLTAIAALTGTSGLLKKTAADTWTLDTNTYLTGNQTITLTGDVSGSGTTSISVTVADDSHNHIIGNIDGLQTALDAKAPLASPALTGTPTAPTAAVDTNTTQIATTAYVVGQGYLKASSYTASDVLTKIKTVDGTSSGLDADLLDGQHGSYYQPASTAVTTTTITNSSINPIFAGTIGFSNDSEILKFNDATNENRSGYWSSKDGFYIQGDGNSVDAVVLKTGHLDISQNAWIEGILGVNNNVSINGTLTATSKSFDIPHPTKENMRLRYGSLEGPENGVYIRGKSSSSIITLPDYWTGLVDEDSITVQLTSIGKHKNLYVKDISNNTVTIGGCRGEFEFFYFIQAERKDIDKLVVEYGS